jgi:hypothetical protein
LSGGKGPRHAARQSSARRGPHAALARSDVAQTEVFARGVTVTGRLPQANTPRGSSVVTRVLLVKSPAQKHSPSSGAHS